MPGPVGLPVVGVMPQLMRDPFGYNYECAKRYGDVYRLPLPVYDVVMFNNPDDVPRVFNTNGGEFAFSSKATAFFSKVMLGGVMMGALDGEPHAQRRKLISPMFSHRGLASVSDVIVDEFDRQLAKWDQWADSGQEFDLQEAIAGVTLPAFLRAMFSATITSAQEQRLNSDSEIVKSQMSAMFLLRPPPNPYKLFRASRDAMAFTRELLDGRIARPADTKDLLSVLVEHHLNRPDEYPYGDLLAESMLLIAAGYETVVAALSWTYALMKDNLDTVRKLEDEVATLGGAKPQMADLKRLTWAKACFDEAQRLKGNPFKPHIAVKDIELGGYSIPAGTMVAISLYSLHRDERWWPDPDRYDPTRFTDEAVATARPRTAFIPFTHGPHHCPGFSMAYMNGQFLMAMITQRYQVTVRPGWQPIHDATGTTTVKGGVPVTITRR
ncbi:cytochrome P450 [Mycobacterium sp. 1164966.3]|uniref:cytochrome P450 n=1 Tax=Mycobacterium sp. 1164966.3 TaxID=1856861 RepID=UPI0015618AC9|nr:cytochrome P450 [Mycobacterium sp. 1164966.3]